MLVAKTEVGSSVCLSSYCTEIKQLLVKIVPSYIKIGIHASDQLLWRIVLLLSCM